jgi:nicotinate-nucleotide adenylyltransferase
MRIGVFGGTFDPIHLGHLILAEQCREQGELDQVWFIPAARPPHKLDRELTPFAQRVEMLNLAIAGNSAFKVEEIERDRPGPSYTADTLDGLRRQYPREDWRLLIGSDTLMDLPNWHEPARVIQQASLLVMVRTGHPVPTEQALRTVFSETQLPTLRLRVVQAPQIDISSRDLRRRASERRSLRYQVPRAVGCYISNKNLYQPEEPVQK